MGRQGQAAAAVARRRPCSPAVSGGESRRAPALKRTEAALGIGIDDRNGRSARCWLVSMSKHTVWDPQGVFDLRNGGNPLSFYFTVFIFGLHLLHSNL